MSTWPEVLISSCARIVGGSTPHTSSAQLWGGDIPWATPKDLSDLDGPYIGNTPRNITGEGLSSCSAELLPIFSVLFSSRAPIGHVAINTVPMATNQGFKSFVPDTTKLDAKFLFHWLRANKAYLNSLGNGATFKEVSKEVVSRIKIPLPEIAEQRRIAAILDQAEALRAKRRQSLAKLDTLTQSLFLEMFGDPASNLKKWPMMPLRKAWAEPPNYGTMVPPTSSGDWLSLRVANIQHDRLDLKDRKFVSLPSRDILRHSLKNGDIIMARAIASQEHLGKCVVVNTEEKFWAFDSHLMRLRLNKSLMMPEFLRAMLTTKGGRTLFLSVTRRSAVQFNVNTKEMGRLELPVPPVHLQKEFVSAVELVEERRKSFHRGYDLLGVTRSSLQHRAFRGEL